MFVWDETQRRHVPIDWNLFKHLCSLRGIAPRWTMCKRLNYNKRVNEVLEDLK